MRTYTGTGQGTVDDMGRMDNTDGRKGGGTGGGGGEGGTREPKQGLTINSEFKVFNVHQYKGKH